MSDYGHGDRLGFVPPRLGARTRHERWYGVPVNTWQRGRKSQNVHCGHGWDLHWRRSREYMPGWYPLRAMPAERLPDNRRDTAADAGRGESG